MIMTPLKLFWYLNIFENNLFENNLKAENIKKCSENNRVLMSNNNNKIYIQ